MGYKTRNQLHEITKENARKYYELNLSYKELNNIEKQIQTGKSLLIHKISNNFTVHVVRWQRTIMVVVYDKKRNCMESMLPISVLKNWAALKANNRRVYLTWKSKNLI